MNNPDDYDRGFRAGFDAGFRAGVISAMHRTQPKPVRIPASANEPSRGGDAVLGVLVPFSPPKDRRN